MSKGESLTEKNESTNIFTEIFQGWSENFENSKFLEWFFCVCRWPPKSAWIHHYDEFRLGAVPGQVGESVHGGHFPESHRTNERPDQLRRTLQRQEP